MYHPLRVEGMLHPSPLSACVQVRMYTYRVSCVYVKLINFKNKKNPVGSECRINTLSFLRVRVLGLDGWEEGVAIGWFAVGLPEVVVKILELSELVLFFVRVACTLSCVLS